MGPCLSEETRYSCLQCTLQFKKHIPRIREMTLNHSMRPNSLQISRCWGNLPRHHPFPPCSGRLNIPVSSRSLIHSFYCIHSFTVYIWGFTRAGVIAWTNGRQIRRPVTAFKETEIHKQAIPTKCETLDLQIQKAQSHHSSPRSKKKKVILKFRLGNGIALIGLRDKWQQNWEYEARFSILHILIPPKRG